MKNKKGDISVLSNETLGIIVALLCISALVIFVALFISSNVQNTGLKQANASMDLIFKTIDNLNAEKNTDLLIPNPSGWHIFVFSAVLRPNSCAGNEYCLCFCPNALIKGGNNVNQINKCDTKGLCSNFPYNSKITDILIKNVGVTINIIKSGDKVIIKKSGDN